MLVDEDLDARQGVHKILCKLRERNLSDHDQQSHAMLDGGGEDFREVLSEVAVGEPNEAHAARS